MGSSSSERGDRPVHMFAPGERAHWRWVGGVWERRADTQSIRLRVGRSRIKGAGNGLFATRDMQDGHVLGQLHGLVVFQGDEDACEDWAIARRERFGILLPFDGAHAIVDVRGTVFALMNHSVTDANVHVRPNDGFVELCTDVLAGGELLWDYGDLYGFGV